MEIMNHVTYIGEGIILTLELLFGGLICGLALGMMLAILRHKGVVVKVIESFISVVRGTPLILQLSFVYFAAPGIVGIKMGVLAAGVITFGLNSSAYIAEILRAGIEGLSKGQFEAAKTLQIPAFYMWRDIIFPQVIRNILPALTNEVIALTKETALISTLGGLDLMRRAQSVASTNFTYFMPLCIAGLYYYALVLLIELTGKHLSKKLGQSSSIQGIERASC